MLFQRLFCVNTCQWEIVHFIFFIIAAYNCRFQFTIFQTICHSLDKQFGIKHFTWVALAGRCICWMRNSNIGEYYLTWMRNKNVTLIIAAYQLVSPLKIIYRFTPYFHHSYVSNMNLLQWWCPNVSKYLHATLWKGLDFDKIVGFLRNFFVYQYLKKNKIHSDLTN